MKSLENDKGYLMEKEQEGAEFRNKALEEIVQITEDRINEDLFTLEEDPDVTYPDPDFLKAPEMQKTFIPPFFLQKTSSSSHHLHRRYVELEQQAQRKLTSSLYLFNAWAEPTPLLDIFSEKRAARDGFFFTFKGKGVGVNPGPDFLLHLKKRGFALSNLDYLVITQEEHPLAQVLDIFTLNSQLNAIRPKAHRIHAYLPSQIYKNFLQHYTPLTRADKEAINSLDYFSSSKEAEEISLFEHVLLKYWPGGAGAFTAAFIFCEGKQTTTLTYFSDLSDLSFSIEECDIAIAGRGKNLSKEKLVAKWGTIAKRFPEALLLLSDVDSGHFDSYLEIFKCLRQEISKKTLPAYDTFSIDIMARTITLDRFSNALTPDKILFLPASNPLQPFTLHPADLCL